MENMLNKSYKRQTDYVRGSNQYQKKKKISPNGMVGAIFILIMSFFTIIHYSTIGIGIGSRIAKAWSKETFQIEAYAPTTNKAYAQEIIIPTPTPTEHEMIISYIKEVFGKDSTKAFTLLSCENHSLNPDAVNDNTTWGGIGQDIGVFQINTIWQGISNKAFLYDWKINVDIAHNIYVRNGDFHLWSCGKRLKI